MRLGGRERGFWRGAAMIAGAFVLAMAIGLTVSLAVYGLIHLFT